MESRLKDFIYYMESLNYDNLSVEETIVYKEKLLTQISFFQHERLVHLIVTVTFALLSILGMILIIMLPNVGTACLEALLVILLIPYIRHYYILENGVQKLYVMFDKFTN